MKYLGIHKVLWCIIVVIFTSLELILVYLPANIVKFIWCFKWNITWNSLHVYKVFNEKLRIIEEVPYGDKNVIDTIKRRYFFVFDNDTITEEETIKLKDGIEI